MDTHETYSLLNSAPQYTSSQETILSPLKLSPPSDLVVNNSLSKSSISPSKPISPTNLIVEDTPERMGSGWKHVQDSDGLLRIKKRKATNLKPRKLKFEDPTGLLEIFLPRFFR